MMKNTKSLLIIIFVVIVAAFAAYKLVAVSHGKSSVINSSVPVSAQLQSGHKHEIAIPCDFKMQDVLKQCNATGGCGETKHTDQCSAVGGCGNSKLMDDLVQYGECKAIAAKNPAVCAQVLSNGELAEHCSKQATINLFALSLGTPEAVNRCSMFFSALPPTDKTRSLAAKPAFCADMTEVLNSHDSAKLCVFVRKYIDNKDTCADMKAAVKGDCSGLSSEKEKDVCGFISNLLVPPTSWQLHAYTAGSDAECAKMEPAAIADYCSMVRDQTVVYAHPELVPSATFVAPIPPGDPMAKKIAVAPAPADKAKPVEQPKSAKQPEKPAAKTGK